MYKDKEMSREKRKRIIKGTNKERTKEETKERRKEVGTQKIRYTGAFLYVQRREFQGGGGGPLSDYIQHLEYRVQIQL